MSFDPNVDPNAGDTAVSDQYEPRSEDTASSQEWQRPERTFTQSELDAVVERRLARERSRYERPTQADPVAPLRAEINQLKQSYTSDKLDGAIASAKAKFKDFEPNHVAIAKVIDDYGIAYSKDAKGQPLSFDKMIEAGYRLWQHIENEKKPPVDLETIKKQAFEEGRMSYLNGKTKTASTTPRAEAVGGGTPTSSDSVERRKTKKGAMDAAIERITKSKQLE